jgi:hypothetical protein
MNIELNSDNFKIEVINKRGIVVGHEFINDDGGVWVHTYPDDEKQYNGVFWNDDLKRVLIIDVQ